MAQLHEHLSKKILSENGVLIPFGMLATSPDEAKLIAAQIGKPVVVKAQIHGTSRAAAGGIKFADSPTEAFLAAEQIFARTSAESVLVDEALEVELEFYLGFIVDDSLKRPVLLFSWSGGSGIEERADSLAKLVCSIRAEPKLREITQFIKTTGAPESLAISLAEILLKLYRSAKSCEARAAEINPFAMLRDGRLVALDARISVDDYAVFRHQELGVAMARELGHEPTKLEKIAWEIEKDDFRGTFYFVEILTEGQKMSDDEERIRIGFHGAGGGGSMASLDAAERSGLKPACYVDTSGNPPASKVYRAAKIILSIPNIRGYFLSGSGVASQEQFVIARAVIKAFLEVQPTVPAVLRLGGNGEETAKESVEKYAAFLPAPFEAYQKNQTADYCAGRLKELIEQTEAEGLNWQLEPKNLEVEFNQSQNWYSFKSRTGIISYDHVALLNHDATPIIKSCPTQILSLNERGLPVLNVSENEAKRGKCVECLACEFAAWDILGVGRGAKIEFPIEGLDLKYSRRKKYFCLCCGCKTLFQPPTDSHEICPICYWEVDAVQQNDPDYWGGSNKYSLKDSQKNFIEFGAKEKRFLEFVRKPNEMDEKNENWEMFS